jgi:hypothetical protein
VEPHRGALLRLLGMMGVAFGVLAIPCAAVAACLPAAPLLAGAWAALAGVLSGWVVWAAGHDLALIRRGLVDPDGTALTEEARSLGLIGLMACLLAGLILGLVLA